MRTGTAAVSRGEFHLRPPSIALLTAIVGAGFGLTPVAAQAPPAGEIPILFNDHHVHPLPDRLKTNRVLAGLVRGTAILVPLRSLFEQTGATVAYDPASKTVDVVKPGSDVKVTVGRPEVVVNGEHRPLDAAPEIYQGTIIVPLRVISEGMGAYVQWVPDRKTVVIRYAAAPPPAPPQPPAPAPTQAPMPSPTAAPVVKARPAHEAFFSGAYLFSPKVDNEFSPGNRGAGVSYAARGALEFSLVRLPLMIEAEYRSIRYPHQNNGTGAAGDPGFVTVIGGYGQTDVPAFIAKDTMLEGRFGVKVAEPRIYVAAGYLHRETNYGYPKQSGVGFGLEKLPDLDRPFSLYGSVYDFVAVRGDFAYPQDTFTCPVTAPTSPCPAGSLYGTTAKLTDRVLTYRLGVSILLLGARDPLGFFFDGGYLGDSIRAKALGPGNASHAGAYLGLGVKL